MFSDATTRTARVEDTGWWSEPRPPAIPFLKWVGGKRWLIPELLRLVPKSIREYHEPFLGGGALYFALEPTCPMINAYLSDTNRELITTYEALQTDAPKVVDLLREHAVEHSRDHFHQVRDAQPSDGFEIAARFIYLNRTCFNGIYRVNKQGRFNTSMGNYRNPRICDEPNLLRAGFALTKAIIRWRSFSETRITDGDLVYCDPPYHESYARYTQDQFGVDDQTQLRDSCVDWAERGATVIVSNSDTPFIRELYKGFDFLEVHPNPRKGLDKSKELLIYHSGSKLLFDG